MIVHQNVFLACDGLYTSSRLLMLRDFSLTTSSRFLTPSLSFSDDSSASAAFMACRSATMLRASVAVWPQLLPSVTHVAARRKLPQLSSRSLRSLDSMSFSDLMQAIASFSHCAMLMPLSRASRRSPKSSTVQGILYDALFLKPQDGRQQAEAPAEWALQTVAVVATLLSPQAKVRFVTLSAVHAHPRKLWVWCATLKHEVSAKAYLPNPSTLRPLQNKPLYPPEEAR